MYLFPKLSFSQTARTAADSADKPVDVFYALALLEATGVCMVPGSGFGQQPGTFHIRSTFLPSEADMNDFIDRIIAFHRDFCNKYP